YWTAADKDLVVKDAAAAVEEKVGVGVHRYGAYWDGISSSCTRRYNAKGLVAGAHMGSYNPKIRNDFDSIYPWSDMKLCNWVSGTATSPAKITAFQGEPGFLKSENLGAYRPEFWYKITQDTSGGIEFIVADGKLPGYTYSPPYMLTAFCVSNNGSGGFQCKNGNIQYNRLTLGEYITKNAAQGMLCEDYIADGTEKLLLTVEFASLNSQSVTGSGPSTLSYDYFYDDTKTTEIQTNSVVVAATTTANFIPLVQTIGIATSEPIEIVHRKLLSITDYPNDATLKRMNFDGAPVDVPFCSIVYGSSMVFDGCPIENESGYIGIDGKAISYYRGAALQTGAWMWIAGISQPQGKASRFFSPLDIPQSTQITDKWIDSGISALETTYGNIKSLQVSDKCPLFLLPYTVGGNDANPVGDLAYISAGETSDLNFRVRGGADQLRDFAYGNRSGAWAIAPYVAPKSDWNIAARSLIRPAL
ncbi:MAG: hypothetical protein RR253_04830, partial [Oscillospiraceae bacterium]